MVVGPVIAVETTIAVTEGIFFILGRLDGGCGLEFSNLLGADWYFGGDLV